jgi:hypothetical protein
MPAARQCACSRLRGTPIAPRRLRAAAPEAPVSEAQPSSSSHAWRLAEERGVFFDSGPAFYRAESAQGRDLAMLAAAAHKRSTGARAPVATPAAAAAAKPSWQREF